MNTDCRIQHMEPHRFFYCVPPDEHNAHPLILCEDCFRIEMEARKASGKGKVWMLHEVDGIFLSVLCNYPKPQTRFTMDAILESIFDPKNNG